MGRDLWRQIRQSSERALQTGALEPIASEHEVIEDSGVAFFVRIERNLERKRTEAKRRPSGTNPFLPYDPDLFVANLGEHHVCLLNKFNVLAHHALIVTRSFQEQESLLEPVDFSALWECLSQTGGLAFYNSGPSAGASQRHKHLQLVPGPIGDGGGCPPIERLLEVSALGDAAVGQAARLPFPHALVGLGDCAAHGGEEFASEVHGRYRALLDACEVPTREPGAYNLLITREWMLVVPRSRKSSCGIEVNALGFAGALFVRSAAQLSSLRERGPMQLLLDVSRE